MQLTLIILDNYLVKFQATENCHIQKLVYSLIKIINLKVQKKKNIREFLFGFRFYP